jgi:predicted HicB family RNase H-like nuclease
VGILKHKDYEGTAELDTDRMVCRGKILFIDDLVTYEANTPPELQKEFEAAVDDYIETCAALGREAKKPLKGQFNVRIPPELHKTATLRAIVDGVSLNDVVVRALDAFVGVHADINHNIHLTVDVDQSSLQTLVSSAAGKAQWGVVSNAKH